MRKVCIAVSVSLLLLTTAGAAEWTATKIPDAWRKVPGGDLAPIDGYSWYRTFVEVPEDWADGELTLVVEALDDARSAWVNGVSVGTNGSFPPTFRSGLGEAGRFNVPSRLLKPGAVNCIAIRVFQNDPRTNFNVAPPVLLNRSSMKAIRMAGDWQYRPGDSEEWARPPLDQLDEEALTVFRSIDSVDDIDRYVAQREGDREPLSPQDALSAFEVPDDLKLELVLSEPEVAQPLYMTWDQRGRLWVMEYRQYPEPAGLKMLSRDVYLRSVYDKVPQPPPHGDRGRDRISIHEDTDGDGVLDAHSVFVDGLNIATSMAIGRGGVYVTNPPYLLFYPDADGDDVPDGDPEVLLEGFGLEDSHSVINSLRFGPDGWLYAVQGSTVTAQVREPGSDAQPIRTVGQQVWRYHPEQKVFEVFAEGGGNAFGMEIDAAGRIYSGHNGGDTRGFHYVQGGYYRKGFAKHGALSNPWTFGFFEAMKNPKVPRFTHNFVIYEEPQLPERFHGKLFGIEPLQGQVVLSDVRPDQSTFQTEDIERVILTDDPWFRPVDIKVGPDGGVYVADMYEQRIDHSSHYAGRIDRTNGRIYRLVARDSDTQPPSVFSQSPSGEELLSALKSPGKWKRTTAVRLLGDADYSSELEMLLQQSATETGLAALASTWGLHAAGALHDPAALMLLQHEDEFVREWTVRLLGDRRRVSAALLTQLTAMAGSDPSIHVRKQLAASARRLSAAQAVPIIRELVRHDTDADEIHQPLMIWWAVETMMASADGRHLVIEGLLEDDSSWQRPLMRDHVLPRLMKRCILPARKGEFLSAAEILRLAPDSDSSARLMTALEEALEGRSLTGIPQPLLDAIGEAGGGSTALQLRQMQPEAIETALALVADTGTDVSQRVQYVEILGEIRLERSVGILLKILNEATQPPLLEAVIDALYSFSDAAIGQTLVERIDELPEDLQASAAGLLAARADWSIMALQAAQDGDLNPDLLTDDALRKMSLHNQPQITESIQAIRGDLQGASTEEMREETARLEHILASGSGNPKAGKLQYMKNCGRCHRLFDEGGQIGPDLTSFKRDDLPRLLQNVVNPDLEIREGYENYLIVADDGRLATGFLTSQDDQMVVLRTTEGASLSFYRDEIDDMLAMSQSVMPKGALKELTDQQVRDLFAYLRASQPVNY